MTINEILSTGDAKRIYTLLTARKKPFVKTLEETEKEFDPYKHKVMDETIRKKKEVRVPWTDAKGVHKIDPQTGEKLYKTKKVERVRVCLPVQQTLVERAVGFLFSIPAEYRMTSDADEQKQKIFNNAEKILKNNKIKYFDKNLCRTLKRARECAELWFFILDDNGKPTDDMRVKLLSPLAGDTLYPHYDKYGRMDAVSRYYSIMDEEGKSTVHFDVYTKEYVHQFIDNGTGLIADGNPKRHGFTKIPIVYYRQEETEWNKVQTAIERVEELISNWGDTNDYFGTPAYVASGKIKGFAEKGETGKVYQLENGAKMDVLSWNSSPESVRGELANLINIIFSYTDSADISFENMKQLGSNTSGAAIKLMFTAPHMKANVAIELFGEMFTRRFNIVLNGLSNMAGHNAIPERIIDEMDVEPVFSPYLPKNEMEEIQIINASTGGVATMSQEEGVKQNPRVKNPDEVLDQIKSEQQEAMQQMAFGAAE